MGREDVWPGRGNEQEGYREGMIKEGETKRQKKKEGEKIRKAHGPREIGKL